MKRGGFMNYAAVDVEWTGKFYKSSIVQLGGIMFDKNGRELSRFLRVLRPAVGGEWGDIAFMGLSDEELNSAVSFSQGFNGFIWWLRGCGEIFVWSDEARLLLSGRLKAFGAENIVKITALQGENNRFGFSSFKKVCGEMGIVINKHLHRSMNDCEYLAQILSRLNTEDKPRIKASEEMPRLRYVKREENNAPFGDSAFFAVKGRAVFHRPECRFVSGRSDDTLTGFYDYLHAQMSGLSPCKCCRPQKEKPKHYLSQPKPSLPLPKPEKWNDEDIIRYCESLELKCRVYEKIIYIYTGAAEWYFKRNKDKIVLHHENRLHKKRNAKWAEEFHIQDKVFTEPRAAIFYIYCHDKRYIRKKCEV